MKSKKHKTHGLAAPPQSFAGSHVTRWWGARLNFHRAAPNPLALALPQNRQSYVGPTTEKHLRLPGVSWSIPTAPDTTATDDKKVIAIDDDLAKHRFFDGTQRMFEFLVPSCRFWTVGDQPEFVWQHKNLVGICKMQRTGFVHVALWDVATADGPVALHYLMRRRTSNGEFEYLNTTSMQFGHRDNATPISDEVRKTDAIVAPGEWELY